MELTSYLLLAVGILGYVDILLYHAISHGIRSHVDSREELIVHSLRGPTYATLFVIVPNFTLHGLYFWVLVGVFVFDIAVSIVDFAIEGKSRKFLGGLPPGEYVLHMLIAMLFGGLVVSFAVSCHGWAHAATAIDYAPAGVPAIIRLGMAIMAAFVLYSGFLDARAAVRLGQIRTSTASDS
ncbi:MAG TPA: hypothetical protein VGK19_07880 [Capsulimonadaceae bacterium]|jgi:hypothetical protein